MHFREADRSRRQAERNGGRSGGGPIPELWHEPRRRIDLDPAARCRPRARCRIGVGSRLPCGSVSCRRSIRLPPPRPRASGPSPPWRFSAITAATVGLHAAGARPAQATSAAAGERPALIPLPASVAIAPAERFCHHEGHGHRGPARTARSVAPPAIARRARTPALEVTLAVQERGPDASARLIRLEVVRPRQHGGDGYELTVSSTGVRIAARRRRRLLRRADAAAVAAVVDRVRACGLRGPFRPSHIIDAPRFAWRGAMLDVARHFFGADDVKRYIDLLASTS